jgi:hypothetical protein
MGKGCSGDVLRSRSKLTKNKISILADQNTRIGVRVFETTFVKVSMFTPRYPYLDASLTLVIAPYQPLSQTTHPLLQLVKPG